MNKLALYIALCLCSLAFAPTVQADAVEEAPVTRCILENGADVYAIAMCYVNNPPVDVQEWIVWAEARAKEQTDAADHMGGVVKAESAKLATGTGAYADDVSDATFDYADKADRHVYDFETAMVRVTSDAMWAGIRVANAQCDLLNGQQCIWLWEGYQETPANSCPQPNQVGAINWALCASERHGGYTVDATAELALDAYRGTIGASTDLVRGTALDAQVFVGEVDEATGTYAAVVVDATGGLAQGVVWLAFYECDVFAGSSGVCTLQWTFPADPIGPIGGFK